MIYNTLSDMFEVDNMNEIKSCPFCGTEITEISGSENVNGHPYWYIYCPVCGANTIGSNDKSVALENWNRRVTNERHNQELK